MEIKFHHNETEGEDWYDDDGDNNDWYGTGGEDFGDFESLMQCFAVCPHRKETPRFTKATAARSPTGTKIDGARLMVRITAAPLHQDDCCVDDEAAIAGITIAVVLAISACCVACCWCAKCCCFQYRRNTPAQVMYVYPPGQGPPGVQMTQMGYPQGTYPNQGYAPGQSQFGAPSYQYTS